MGEIKKSRDSCETCSDPGGRRTGLGEMWSSRMRDMLCSHRVLLEETLMSDFQ